jgi:predicted glycosyltransferase
LQLALIVCLLVLIFAVAAAVVAFEDKRAARREAMARQARLTRLGEVDPLAPHRLRANG